MCTASVGAPMTNSEVKLPITNSSVEIETPNGEARELEWMCGGYRFRRVTDYANRVPRLPQLAGSRDGRVHEANPGERVVTFVAESVGGAASRASSLRMARSYPRTSKQSSEDSPNRETTN